MHTQDGRSWYLGRDGKQHGPITDAELKKLAELKHLRPDDLLWCAGMADWLRADAVGLGGIGDPEAPPAAAPGAAKIFISYRRATDQWVARAMFEHLSARLGANKIFFDLDGIAPGQNFRDVLRRNLNDCVLFIPVMGPEWLKAKVETGHYIALRQPNDFVRMEIEVALERSKTDEHAFLVPLLVDGTSMPRKEDLPISIQGLSDCQALAVDSKTFGPVMRTIEALYAQGVASTSKRAAGAQGALSEAAE